MCRICRLLIPEINENLGLGGRLRIGGWGRLGTRTPLGPISFDSIQFLGTNDQNNSLVPPFLGWGEVQ